MASSVFTQRSAASAVAVKLNATKIFNGRSPRAHARKGSAFRTTRVGTAARSAVRSATLPISQRLSARLPMEETTSRRQELGLRPLDELLVRISLQHGCVRPWQLDREAAPPPLPVSSPIANAWE